MLKKNSILKTALDDYKIIRQIGQGGNGTIFEALNNDNTKVAIKVIPRDTSIEKLKRFRNEINFGQKYSNDNIIKILDSGTYSNTIENIFYVMPLCDGSLRDLIKTGLKSERIIDILTAICKGLQFAHNKGCIHRDLKPENILYDKNGYYIADFGIAHFESDDKITYIETKESSRLANFSYHAPEQVNGKTTFATDIFALGLILNEMFTGKVPAGDNYVKIGDIDKKYSFLDDVVKRMISQDPSNRYKSIDELNIDISARENKAKISNKIEELKMPLIDVDIKDDLIDNPIVIQDININDSKNIYLKITNNPNDIWLNIYRDALNPFTNYPYCYKNAQLQNCTIFYDISSFYYSGNRDDLIRGLIGDIKRAINIANIEYPKRIENIHRLKKEAEIKRREEEIKRMEEKLNMQSFLKDLI